jgi:predicted nucleotidyltransferase
MAQANLFPDFRECIESLNSARVKFLVVGGYAVNFHGYHRVTKDIDFWVATDAENAQRVVHVLQTFGGMPASKAQASILRRPDTVLIMGRPPVRIDILTGVDGVSFEECYARRVMTNWDGVKVPVIALNDLISNKRASGRPKDLADVEALTNPTIRAKRPRRRK